MSMLRYENGDSPTYLNITRAYVKSKAIYIWLRIRKFHLLIASFIS
jgi:hypothetical protein